MLLHPVSRVIRKQDQTADLARLEEHKYQGVVCVNTFMFRKATSRLRGMHVRPILGLVMLHLHGSMGFISLARELPTPMTWAAPCSPSPYSSGPPTELPLDSTNQTLQGILLPDSGFMADQMSGTDLAYIGDSVFELFVRCRYVWPTRSSSDLQRVVVSNVRAERQSQMLHQLKDEFPLTDQEYQILMRGRNAGARSKNRRDPAAYQGSTALEALIGYLYMTNQSRCSEVLNWLQPKLEAQ